MRLIGLAVVLAAVEHAEQNRQTKAPTDGGEPDVGGGRWDGDGTAAQT